MIEDEVRSQARSIYLRLRTKIIRGEFAPMHKLKIGPLADEMETNSSAVREALSRLTAEYLVEARDQKGFRVAPISLEELDDLAANRIEIETRALTRSMQTGDKAWERRVRSTRRRLAEAENDARPSADGAAAHNAFHDALVSACDSPTLLRIRQSLYELSERYRWLAAACPLSRRDVRGEHDMIAEAALARDAEAAKSAVAAHIQHTSDQVRKVIDQQVLISASPLRLPVKPLALV